MQIMQIAFLATLILGLLGGCSALNQYLGLPDDHPFEQMIEQQIKEGLDLDVDLSPESDE